VDVVEEVTGWEGVSCRPLAEGGTELSYRGRPLGRVRADGVVELCLHPRVRDMLVETGRAEPHADPGVAVFRGPAVEAVELLRLAWERARVAAAVRDARGGRS
jgi:hypothetical protein